MKSLVIYILSGALVITTVTTAVVSSKLDDTIKVIDNTVYSIDKKVEQMNEEYKSSLENKNYVPMDVNTQENTKANSNNTNQRGIKRDIVE